MVTRIGGASSSATPREPSPAERAVLQVYLEAERVLLGSVAAEVRGVVDADDQDTDARRTAGIRNVAAAAFSVYQALEGTKRDLVTEALDTARRQGVAATVAQLGAALTGARDQDAIPRTALDRLAASVIDRMTEAHLSILRTTVDIFRDVVSRVLPAALVGAETRRTATQRALWAFTDRGITGFVDTAGRRWSLSAYAEMAVRAATARAMVDGQLDALTSNGRDLVIVSGSNDRCPECRPWSGKVLSISGGVGATARVEHPTRDGEFLTVRVAGSVGEARAAGLLHPQCRCSLSAYTPGLTRAEPPAVDNGQYAARQEQRRIERGIRAWKAREAAALDDTQAKKARDHTRAWQGRMRDHLGDNPDLLRRRYREQPGTGNKPPASLVERYGPGGPIPDVL